jgi:hypothetical protein
MRIKEGTVAETLEVRARWAYGEMASDRFGPRYAPHAPQHLLDAVRRGDLFDTIGPQEWPTLSQLLDHARPNEYLHRELLKWPKFRCAYWSASELDSALAIRAFNMPHQAAPFPYKDFYAGLPNTGTNGTVWGFSEPSDPRVQAFRTPDAPQSEPGVAIEFQSQYLLVDGYLRSVVFRRQRDPLLRFAVWVPA